MFGYWSDCCQGSERVPKLLKYIHQFTFDEALPTASVDLRKGDLTIWVQFFLDHITGPEDVLFILFHERNHLILRRLYPDVLPGGDYPREVFNFAEDAYVNAIGRRQVASTLPERFYRQLGELLLTARHSAIDWTLFSLGANGTHNYLKHAHAALYQWNLSFNACLECARARLNRKLDCPFDEATIAGMILNERKGTDISVTMITGCQRAVFINQFYETYVSPGQLYWAFRGQIAHKILEEANLHPDAVKEKAFTKAWDGIDVIGHPDLIIPSQKVLKDYKTTKTVPSYLNKKGVIAAYDNHRTQLNIYRWLVPYEIAEMEVVYFLMEETLICLVEIWPDESTRKSEMTVRRVLVENLVPLKMALDSEKRCPSISGTGRVMSTAAFQTFVLWTLRKKSSPPGGPNELRKGKRKMANPIPLKKAPAPSVRLELGAEDLVARTKKILEIKEKSCGKMSTTGPFPGAGSRPSGNLELKSSAKGFGWHRSSSPPPAKT